MLLQDVQRKISRSPFQGVIAGLCKTDNVLRVESRHQNAIFEIRIKLLTLGIHTLLLHATRLCPEYVSTMISLKEACQRYNSLEMDKNGKMPDQKFSGMEFQISEHTITHRGSLSLS